MSQIDLTVKDKRILKELFENARYDYSEISKKVKLSKEVVNYRIKRMEKLGLIVGYNTIIDPKKLGWEIYFAYIRLTNVNNQEEELIVKRLVENENISQVLRVIGNYDIILKMFCKSYQDANIIIKKIFSDFKQKLDFYKIDFVEEDTVIPLRFLYDMNEKEKNFEKNNFKYKKINIKKIDLEILKTISKNARLQLSEISKILNTPRDTIKYHLRNLEDGKIIKKYRPSCWPGGKKLGYNWYFVILEFEQLNKLKLNELNEYIKNHKNVTYYYKTTGNSDIQFEIRLKTNDELKDVLMEIRNILHDKIKRHEITIILSEHKYTYYPKCIEDSEIY